RPTPRSVYATGAPSERQLAARSRRRGTLRFRGFGRRKGVPAARGQAGDGCERANGCSRSAPPPSSLGEPQGRQDEAQHSAVGAPLSLADSVDAARDAGNSSALFSVDLEARRLIGVAVRGSVVGYDGDAVGWLCASSRGLPALAPCGD
ncbi:MAG TPA: hypothetical protein VF989_04250, partial [Polyangiaceae bacterium]